MRISDWSSDVCSSDLAKCVAVMGDGSFGFNAGEMETLERTGAPVTLVVFSNSVFGWIKAGQDSGFGKRYFSVDFSQTNHRSEEHTSELQSLMRISYAVFCLKKKTYTNTILYLLI